MLLADLILTMTPAHPGCGGALSSGSIQTFTLGLYATGAPEAAPDAYGKPMEAYRAVAAQLDHFIPLALAKAAAPRP